MLLLLLLLLLPFVSETAIAEFIGVVGILTGSWLAAVSAHTNTVGTALISPETSTR